MERRGLEQAVEAPEAFVADVRPPFAQAGAGESVRADVLKVAAGPLPVAVGPFQEPDLRIEIVADFRVAEVPVVRAPTVLERRAVGMIAAGQSGRLCLRRKSADGDFLGDPQPAIEAERAVPAVDTARLAGGGAVDEDAADGRSVPQILAHPNRREVVGGRQVDALGLHVHQADVDAVGVAGQPRAALDGHELAVVADADAAAEEQVDLAALADGEQPAVLEEERPLLGKEQVEPCQVDLLLVDLHLREVGVVGQVERHARRHADLAVDAPVGVFIGRGLSQEITIDRSDRVGHQLEVARRRHVEIAKLAGRGQAAQRVDA